MATVTGMTAEKTQALTDEAFVGVDLDAVSGALTFTKQNGAQVSPGVVPNTANIIDAVFPVGAIHFTTNNVNPAALGWPGTWTAWGSGRVPVGVDVNQTEFDTAEEVGGSKTHTLTANEMPVHNHYRADHTHAIDHDHPSFQTSNMDGTHAHDVDSDNQVGSMTGVFARGNTAQWSGSGMMSGTGGGHNHTINVPALSNVNSGAASASSTGDAGGGAAHSILQPYITCYMWKRTA